MEIQSILCKQDGIYLSEINTNCMFVWGDIGITHASTSGIAANALFL